MYYSDETVFWRAKNSQNRKGQKTARGKRSTKDRLLVLAMPMLAVPTVSRFLSCVNLRFFVFIYHIYPPFTRKRIVLLCFGRNVRTRLEVAISEVFGLPVFHIKVWRPIKCLAQEHNQRTCRFGLHNFP